MKDLGERLRALRLNAGLSQQEVADAIGVGQAAYAQYETGARQPSIEKIIALRAVLNADYLYLLEGKRGQRG